MKAFVEELAAVHKQMAAGNFQLAAQACTQQLTASASDIPFLALLTAACEHAGEVGKARDAAARWVNMAPLDAYAHYKLGMLEQRFCDQLGKQCIVAGDDLDFWVSLQPLANSNKFRGVGLCGEGHGCVCFRAVGHSLGDQAA